MGDLAKQRGKCRRVCGPVASAEQCYRYPQCVGGAGVLEFGPANPCLQPAMEGLVWLYARHNAYCARRAIKSFADKATAALFSGRRVRSVRSFPLDIHRRA
jgi:hypothetical protein